MRIFLFLYVEKMKKFFLIGLKCSVSEVFRKKRNIKENKRLKKSLRELSSN